MYKLVVSLLLVSIIIMFTSASYAQDYKDRNILLIQTFKIKGPMGSDADAFREMLARQGNVLNNDPRVLRGYAVRHFWGADSRDLVLVTEFKNLDDLFSFSNDSDALLEKAFSKEQLKTDNELWSKYVGQHADEIYWIIPGTKK
jgi:hypothetical protein